MTQNLKNKKKITSGNWKVQRFDSDRGIDFGEYTIAVELAEKFLRYFASPLSLARNYSHLMDNCYLFTILLKYSHLFKIFESVINFYFRKISNSTNFSNFKQIRIF